MRARWAGRGAGDEGRILLLSLGFALVAMVLVLTVVAASAVHLQRKRVLAVADAAAADAAGAVDDGAYYGPGGGVGVGGAVPLSDASVRAAVADFLERSGAGVEVEGLSVAAGTGSPDGRTAVVELSAHLRPPWSQLGPVRLGDGFEVRVRSAAVARLHRGAPR